MHLVTNCSLVALTFKELHRKQRFLWEKVFTLEETVAFCRVSGDHNRIHTDDEFAKARGFTGAVVHGVRSLAEISKACGDHFFVPGVVCQNLEAEFKRPVYHGVPYEFELEVDGLFSGRRKEVLLLFYVSRLKVCISGKVRIFFP